MHIVLILSLISHYSFLIQSAPQNLGLFRWVAIGDSITYLNDHLSETKHVTKGYMTQVLEQFPSVRYQNRGMNGRTTELVVNHLQDMDIQMAEIYSIFLGTNDWGRGNRIGSLTQNYLGNTGSNTFYGAYRLLIDHIKQINSDAIIILITPMQRGDFVYHLNMMNHAHGSYRKSNGQLLSSFADAVIQLSNHESFHLVDLYNHVNLTIRDMVHFKRCKNLQTGVYTDLPYPAYVDVPFDPMNDLYPYPEPAGHMTYDGLHPSDLGNSIIAKLIVSVLEKEFKNVT